MTPEEKAEATRRDAEHIELIALMREAVENTRKILEMWDRENVKPRVRYETKKVYNDQ